MRANVFGINFDPLDQSMLIGELVKRVREGRPGYVLPTNLHHVLQLRRDVGLRLAFADASALTVPDSRPLLWMARLRGITMQPAVGADLVIPLCRAAAQEQLSVFFFGTTFGVLAECGRRLSSLIEELRIAGVYSPPFGFERDPDESALAVSVIRAAAPDIVLIALSVPKQEVWAHKHATQLKVQAICLGAALDFLGGAQRRAPTIFRRVGFEWLWRMLTEPRRLGMRYLTILCWMPFLVIRELTTPRQPIK
jgi:N-acetylglucosaminyldiphosphoundecaprenol N-acetyl-beta-D-mannosaminyltransferase